MSDWLQLFVGASTNAAIYALVAFSLVLVYRGSGVINFGVGYMAVFAGIFFANTGSSGWSAFLLALLLGAVLGVLCYGLAIRIGERAGASSAALAMAALGFGLALNYFGGQFWPREGFTAPALWDGSHEVAGVTISNQRILTVVIALVAFGLLLLLLERTMIGWALEAVAFRRSTAGLYGVNPVVALVLVWALAGALAAMAGLLRTPTSAVSLEIALPLAIQGFAAAVLGGLGSVNGAAVGAIVVAFAEAVFVRYVSSDYASFFAFMLLFVMMAVRPQGILGSRREVARA